MLESNQQLTDEALQATLRRAREIAEGGPKALAADDLTPYLAAAEEMGIPREAMVRAFREQMLLPHPTVAGTQMFAPAADGNWYVATVLEAGAAEARVQFAAGGERVCALTDLHPLDLVPGKKLQAEWPGNQGWWTSSVTRVMPEKGKVTVSWAGSSTTVPLSKLRFRPSSVPHTREEKWVRGALLLCALLAGTSGILLGVLADRLYSFLSHVVR